MDNQFITNSKELSLYINTVESFFERNYPELEKKKFWPWFFRIITQKDYDINNLSSEETDEILNKLKKINVLLSAT